MWRFNNYWEQVANLLPYALPYLLVVGIAASLFDTYYRKNKSRSGPVARTNLIGSFLFLILFLVGLPLPKVGDWQVDLRLIFWILGAQGIMHLMAKLLIRSSISRNETRKLTNTFAAFFIIPLIGVGLFLLTR